MISLRVLHPRFTGDHTISWCIAHTFRVSGEAPVFAIIAALDELPSTTDMPTPSWRRLIPTWMDYRKRSSRLDETECTSCRVEELPRSISNSTRPKAEAAARPEDPGPARLSKASKQSEVSPQSSFLGEGVPDVSPSFQTESRYSPLPHITDNCAHHRRESLSLVSIPRPPTVCKSQGLFLFSDHDELFVQKSVFVE